MRIPAERPELNYTIKVRAEILEMAQLCGIKVAQREDASYLLIIGDDQYLIPERSLHKRLLAELGELAGSRICYGFHEHMFYTLRKLSKPVLIRAVHQGIAQRMAAKSPNPLLT